ncbi:hypothetical protein [Glaciihabitans sp. UYNi722]|uniref:hypothetical protein n=1 Tax=Glaciihabitans sp. UYNi722 TaxID=3156344 RepID=UPI0033948769
MAAHARTAPGCPSTVDNVADLSRFASDLAGFLIALRGIHPADGPAPGVHNFYRGRPLAVYDAETRDALAALERSIDTDAARDVWRRRFSRTGLAIRCGSTATSAPATSLSATMVN